MRPTRPFILLLLLAVLIPGADTLRAARPYRPGFLYREGPRLMLDGKPYRSASFNACQFSGCGHPYELFPDREIDSLMATLPPGMLIRTWAFPGSEDRTARLLQMADRHGHKLLLTLGDGRSSCGHHDGARDGDGSGKRPEWYADGYRREYLPHVRRMVEKFKDARGVGMWEILNEAGDADWRVIKRFYDTVAAEIKRIDPDHLVSTGSWAPWAYGGLEHFRELHAGPSIDVGCVHEYDYDFQEQNTIASPHVDVALQALHGLDKVLIVRDGHTYRRTPEVLDCWFESGSMPYAQQHYPFSGKALEGFFPADFIAEGLDQTRGWFYTLLVLGTLLFGKAPYKNVVVNGLVLAEDGKKMSKRLKNYPDPNEIIQKYGADALRLYLINSPVVRAENLRFSENGVRQILRDLLIPWWNAYSFFVTYANADGFDEPEVARPDSTNVLDRWIVSSMETLIADVTSALDTYDLQRAVRPFVAFVDDLTNWYIRRSRRRFWKSEDDTDKRRAYRTLRYVLVQLSKVAAPFCPFVSEQIYRNLRGASDPESVHLCDFPVAEAAARDLRLEEDMALVQRVVSLGRQLRTDEDLKVRQPLARLRVASADAALRTALAGYADIVREELNVKDVAFDEDETAFATLSLKADFKALGPRFGAKMKAAAAAIAALGQEQAAALARGETVSLSIQGEEATLGPGDVVIRREPREGLVVAAEGDVVVALETALTPALVAEGLMREFVSKVQALRKEADLEVTQRIDIAVQADDEVSAALEAWQDTILEETQADALVFGEVPADPIDLNGHEIALAIDAH